MWSFSGRAGVLAGVAVVALSGGSALAQNTTATVRGTTAPGATVVARELATNQRAEATGDAAGRYVLSGLRPGAYEISASAQGAQVATRNVTVGVGQSLTVDLTAASDTTEVAEVVVTAAAGARLIELETSEVATNVSPEQIRTLPQTDRNFLSFAALAPGVRYNDTQFGRGFTAGAGNPADVNVFIDGLSLKNNVLQGGIAGQEGSRGNPFPQLAVSEFRVLTQNYKAEYEQASSAVITAVTRSGSNRLSGEAFGQYTDDSLTEQDVFSEAIGADEPTYERKQYGAALGDAIIPDRLFLFGAYERNQQTRAEQVRLNSTDPALLAQFGEYLGFFSSPFEQDLYFGKLTWTPDDRQTLDLSINLRREEDVRDFGRNTAFSAATLLKNEVDTYLARHTYRGNGFVNEAAVSYLEYNYNPTRLTPGPTFNYSGYIQIGGATQTRDIRQATVTLRDDLTLDALEWRGSHVVKLGARYASQDYDLTTTLYAEPYFEYREPDLGIPYLANLGVGDPRIQADNFQVGLYLQDDWEVNDNLTLNLGLRWDYEDNQFNNDFVTPANVRAALRALPRTFYFSDPEGFITDGDDRPRDYGMIQPRLGFSYDVNGDARTVVFGGYGRYFDRNAFANTLNERYRQQYNVATFYFSRDGAPNVEGQPTVVYDPRYLTRAGLESLRANAQTGFTEVFVVQNDAKSPYSDQFTLGLRQRFGQFYASAAATYIEGHDGITNIFVNRDLATGDCCVTGPGTPAGDQGFAFVTTAISAYETRYKGLYVTLDKPYSEDSGWGLSLAYTLAEATQNGDPSIYGGSGFFSYNCLTPDSCGFNPRLNDARHTLVISGQVDLPFDMKLSTLTTLSSPTPYLFENYTNGFSYSTQNIDFDRLRQDANCLGAFSRCTVDVKLQKDFELAGRHEISLYVDVFNLFNNKNYGQYDGYTGFGGEPSPTFGQPLDLATRPRGVQVGASYRF